MSFLIDINNIIIISATAAMILLMKKILKGKMTPKWQLGIWVILLVQLCLLPIGDASTNKGLMPSSSVSIQNYVPQIKENPIDEISHGENKITMVIPGTDSTVLSGNSTMRFLSKDYEGTFYFIWKIGAALMAILLVSSYCKLQLKCRKYKIIEDLKTIEIFQKCKSLVGVKRNIKLKKGVKTPFLAGLINPTIYISNSFDDEEANYIFIHELCHYKHKDLFLNILAATFLCLMWYNPLIWISFAVIRRDLEIYCDYRAVEISGEKKEYAKVLLKAATCKERFTLATTSFANGEKEMSERIKYIARFKKPGIVAIIISVILVIALSMFLLLDGKQDLNKDAENIISNSITLKGLEYKTNEVEDAIKSLIDNSLVNYVNSQASSADIVTDYKINSIEKVEPLAEIPSPEGDGASYANQARWDILYPGTMVMEVDYDLISSNENKDTDKSYAVFTKTHFLNKVKSPTITMLGFVSEEELEQHVTLDEAVFSKVHNWYRENVEPVITDEFHTAYLGNPSAVLNIVAALPLRQLIDTKEGTFTDKGLVLQTATEPYGLTINYYSDDPLYSLYPDGEEQLNHYVEAQIATNANLLFKSIDNLGTVTINLTCQRDVPKIFKYEFSREGQ